MTPNELAKSGTEHAHQRAFFAYCNVALRYGWDIADAWCKEGEVIFKSGHHLKGTGVAALEWIHAIHNQGHGDAIRGGKAKAEGVKAGVADIFLPWSIKEKWNKKIVYCGLYIEMKKPSVKPKSETAKGGMSDEQIAFKAYALNQNYGFMTCYSWEEAVSVVRIYIERGA